MTPYLNIFHRPIGDEDFFKFLRSEKTSTMICTVCKTTWRSEKQSDVLIPMEYDEKKSLCQSLTHHFKKGFFTKRCCHKCHNHELGATCTKKVGDNIPEKDLVKVHVQPKLTEVPQFLIVELRQFKTVTLSNPITGKIDSHTVYKVHAPRSYIIGEESKIDENLYEPFTVLSHIGDDPTAGHFLIDIKTHLKDNENCTQWIRISDDQEPTRCHEPRNGYLYVFRLKSSPGDDSGSLVDDPIQEDIIQAAAAQEIGQPTG